VDFFDVQHWHPTIKTGRGLLTVGEAVWFKKSNKIEMPDSSKMKGAAIALALDYKAVSYNILKDNPGVRGICRDMGFQTLVDNYETCKRIEEEFVEKWRKR
jgi:hypothetical protein